MTPPTKPKLDGFEFLEYLGGGGLGRVWKAQDVKQDVRRDAGLHRPGGVPRPTSPNSMGRTPAVLPETPAAIRLQRRLGAPREARSDSRAAVSPSVVRFWRRPKTPIRFIGRPRRPSWALGRRARGVVSNG
jgi:hypothetical protein